jgi:hypothetical protein
MRYLMEESTREQMAAEDPFGGRGTFLPFPGLGGTEISAELEEKGLGSAPSFVWDGIGAWVEVDRARGA